MMLGFRKFERDGSNNVTVAVDQIASVEEVRLRLGDSFPQEVAIIRLKDGTAFNVWDTGRRVAERVLAAQEALKTGDGGDDRREPA